MTLSRRPSSDPRLVGLLAFSPCAFFVVFVVFVVAFVFVFASASIAAADVEEPSSSQSDVESSTPPIPPSQSTDESVSEASATMVAAPPPIGTRHSQSLPQGDFRVGYSYERIRFREIMVSSTDRTQSEILAGGFYQKVPTELDVTLHDFEVAYAPHSRVTLVVTVPFVEKELQEFSPGPGGGRSERQTDGIGDLEFSVIVPFIKKGSESSQFHISVIAPTGSIRRGGDLGRLPYDLQIGNGTWDLEWGWTYRRDGERVAWGGQFYGIHPVGTNGLHYREGSRFNASAWTAVNIAFGISASVRVGVAKWNNIRGSDRSLDLATDGPSANPKARGGHRVDISPGLSWTIPNLVDQTLSVEFGLPVYHELDGPQLSQESSLKVGWRWVF